MGHMERKEFSRRSFLKGAVAAAATGAVAATGLTGCADKTPAYLPETWDMETDILVVGAGGAGLGAAITALDEKLGEVLVLDAAPEKETGGNSRVCGQTLFIPQNVPGAVTYQTNLNGPYVVEAELVEAWAKNICENYDWLKRLGADLQLTTNNNPEYPAVKGSEASACYFHKGTQGKQVAYKLLKDYADEKACTFEYDTRALQLVFEPSTKEVLGVKAQQGDKLIAIKARKGVILACGGFENNEDMIRQYFVTGYPEVGVIGTPYNRGDGIKMAQSVGAELWHMNSYAFSYLSARCVKDRKTVCSPSWKSKDYIHIGPNGKRFIYEEAQMLAKHGLVDRDGAHVKEHVPCPQYAVFGQKAFTAGPILADSVMGWQNVTPKAASDNQGFVDAGFIFKANTVRELAQKIGLDPGTLEKTVNDYNAYCVAGKDPDFHRGEDFWAAYGGMQAADTGGTMRVVIKKFPLVALEPPFYAIRLYHTLLNTQGGPKRNVSGQLVDTSGAGIPRLFAAGELGAIYPFLYNAGGNFSDAISSGRLAARSAGALTPWEE